MKAVKRRLPCGALVRACVESVVGYCISTCGNLCRGASRVLQLLGVGTATERMCENFKGVGW